MNLRIINAGLKPRRLLQLLIYAPLIKPIFYGLKSMRKHEKETGEKRDPAEPGETEEE